MKIHKGDTVIILSGKDKGKEGKVTKTLHEDSRVIVDGVNVRKRHVKQRGNKKGQIVEFSAPLDVSNVALKDPKEGKPTRVGYKVEEGRKTRVAKKSNTDIK